IAALMRQERIAVLAVQETHLTEQLTEQANAENPTIMIISNSTQSNKEGVAYIINRRELNLEIARYTHEILIPNRASRLKLSWGTDNELDLINVYMPNEPLEKIQCIQTVEQKLSEAEGVENPIIMGDWNFVEEAIDRSPMHEDDNRIKDAFRVLKHKYNLIDGWRMNNDEDIGFTFSARDTNSLSRIDRIYAAKNAYLYTVDWKIQATGKISDHEMV
ncbi:Endonuclease/exonuclease/phosphatase, partial [Dichomitus squalens]